MSKNEQAPEQDPAPEDTQVFQEQQGSPEQRITVNVDPNEFNIIMAGLQELPHRVVDPIIRKLITQAQIQL
jgi:hypothetical protein